jgi:hypothetical protein
MQKTNGLLTYSLLFTITLLVYSITYQAGFVTDFMGWLHSFDHYTFTDVVNSEANNIKSFYHFTHILMYGFTALFGRSGLPWFLVFAALFSLNAFLVFTFFIKIFDAFEVKNGETIAWIGILAFILSPYQAEIMVWRASFHYLTAFAMMMGIVHLVMAYLKNPLPRYIYIALGIFVCSVFSLEFFLFTPLVVFLILAFLWLSFPDSFNLKKVFFGFVFTPLSIMSIYFVAHYFMRGEWFAHGRGAANLNILSLNSFSTYAQYLLKELFFIRYLDSSLKKMIFSSLTPPSVSWGILGIFFTVFSLGLFFFERFSGKNKALYLCFGLFSLLLLPVLNLYFSWELLSENDRYGYMASAFLFMGFALFLSKLPQIVFYAISIIYLGISGFFLLKTNKIWWESEQIYSQVTTSFKWWKADEILVLNAPDNYEGIPMFRVMDTEDSGIREAVEVYNKKDLKAQMVDVLQYNLTSPKDGVKVQVLAADTLVVTLNQWGNWWFHKGIGASDYETDDYKVKIDFNGCGRCYKFILKNKRDNRVILFQNGGTLKEVDLEKIGVEQE